MMLHDDWVKAPGRSGSGPGTGLAGKILSRDPVWPAVGVPHTFVEPVSARVMVDAPPEKSDLLIDLAPPADSRPLLPLKHPIYRKFWQEGMSNNWVPTEISMAEDIANWRGVSASGRALSDKERHMVMINLGFFANAEILINTNVQKGLISYITNPEAGQALNRLSFEETIHNETFMYICESLGLNDRQVYHLHHELPAVQAKEQFMVGATEALASCSLDLRTMAGKRVFMEALLAQMIMEGVFFYSGFAMILRLKNSLPGIGQQYEYIMRDESLHIKIIRQVFNHLKEVEWPGVWTAEFQEFTLNKFREAVILEAAYARECLPEGMLGLRSEMFLDYVQFMADRRLRLIGFEHVYHAKNPFPWMSALSDLDKETNFFEKRVIEYESALKW